MQPMPLGAGRSNENDPACSTARHSGLRGRSRLHTTMLDIAGLSVSNAATLVSPAESS